MIRTSVSQSTETLQSAMIGERQRFETLLLEQSTPAAMPQRTRRPTRARSDYDPYANTDERNLLLVRATLWSIRSTPLNSCHYYSSPLQNTFCS
jgi:hypothetical protein